MHRSKLFRRWRTTAAALVWLAGPAVALRADVLTLNPSADTTLLEYFPENNFGGQVWFNAGTTQNGPRNRGLLRFDLASLIPFGATINNVSLQLEVVGQPIDGDAPSTFELHLMLRDWGEGTGTGQPPLLGRPALAGEANWNFRFAGTGDPWGAPGGLVGVDFAEFASGDTYVYGTSLSPYLWEATPEMVDDVQRWLNDPTQNFGWMLLSRSEGDRFSARRFASREDPFRAPVLMIDFTPVPEPSATFLGGAIVVVAASWRLGRRTRRPGAD